jgi:hypothetical protein
MKVLHRTRIARINPEKTLSVFIRVIRVPQFISFPRSALERESPLRFTRER